MHRLPYFACTSNTHIVRTECTASASNCIPRFSCRTASNIVSKPKKVTKYCRYSPSTKQQNRFSEFMLSLHFLPILQCMICMCDDVISQLRGTIKCLLKRSKNFDTCVHRFKSVFLLPIFLSSEVIVVYSYMNSRFCKSFLPIQLYL